MIHIQSTAPSRGTHGHHDATPTRDWNLGHDYGRGLWQKEPRGRLLGEKSLCALRMLCSCWELRKCQKLSKENTIDIVMLHYTLSICQESMDCGFLAQWGCDRSARTVAARSEAEVAAQMATQRRAWAVEAEEAAARMAQIEMDATQREVEVPCFTSSLNLEWIVPDGFGMWWIWNELEFGTALWALKRIEGYAVNVFQHGGIDKDFLWTTSKQNPLEPGDLPVLTAAKGWDAEGLSAAATGSCGQREWSTQCCSLTSKVFVLFLKDVQGAGKGVRRILGSWQKLNEGFPKINCDGDFDVISWLPKLMPRVSHQWLAKTNFNDSRMTLGLCMACMALVWGRACYGFSAISLGLHPVMRRFSGPRVAALPGGGAANCRGVGRKRDPWLILTPWFDFEKWRFYDWLMSWSY